MCLKLAIHFFSLKNFMYKFFLKDAENHEHNEKCLFSSVVFVIISFVLEIRKRNSNGIWGVGKGKPLRICPCCRRVLSLAES